VASLKVLRPASPNMRRARLGLERREDKSKANDRPGGSYSTIERLKHRWDALSGCF
jgi:hypothetical protein